MAELIKRYLRSLRGGARVIHSIGDGGRTRRTDPPGRRPARLGQRDLQEVLGRHAEQAGEGQEMAHPQDPLAGDEVVPRSGRQGQGLLDRTPVKPGRGRERRPVREALSRAGRRPLLWYDAAFV